MTDLLELSQSINKGSNSCQVSTDDRCKREQRERQLANEKARINGKEDSRPFIDGKSEIAATGSGRPIMLQKM
jgi:hypothetical protein